MRTGGATSIVHIANGISATIFSHPRFLTLADSASVEVSLEASLASSPRASLLADEAFAAYPAAKSQATDNRAVVAAETNFATGNGDLLLLARDQTTKRSDQTGAHSKAIAEAEAGERATLPAGMTELVTGLESLRDDI